MSAVVSGLIGAVLAVGLVWLAERTHKSATITHDGWKALRAGWLNVASIMGATALAAFIGYFLLSGGSSLPDSTTQNGIAALLFVTFAGCALYMVWTTYGRTVMWKGNELRVRTVWGSESLRHISDATKLKKSETRGEYRITFRDRSTLWFSAHMYGANELVGKLPRRAFGE